MLLQDFNYFLNKTINQYVNKRYNIYDVNQQTTDDLRVLKATSILTATPSINKVSELDGYQAGASNLFGGFYEVILPSDYFHILNCICIYKVKKNYKCYNKGDYVQFAAKRITADSWSVIINDYFNRPLPQRPYFYINNINSNTSIPTNPITLEDGVTKGTDSYNSTKTTYQFSKIENNTGNLSTWYGDNLPIGQVVYSKDQKTFAYFYNKSYYDSSSQRLNNFIDSNTNKPYTDRIFKCSDTYYKYNGESLEEATSSDLLEEVSFPRTIVLGNSDERTVSTIDKEAGLRYSNSSLVRMEIRYGSNDIFELEKVFIDYIKSPQHIRLTQEQVNLTEDTSQIMEFPDYVCQEIINELTMLVMENIADPRLQTHSIVTQSIANPAQQQIIQPQPQQTQRG